MINDIEIIYRSQPGYLKRFKKALAQKKQVELVLTGWRARLAARSVDHWPESESHATEIAQKLGHSWDLLNMLFPSMFVMHWAFMNAGYKKTHTKSSTELRINYTPRETRGSQATSK
jgi:hypothetical protein